MVRNFKKIFLMFLITILCFSTQLFAAEYNVENYKIDATVKQDGSMDVIEYLKYHFDADMNGVYRDILYKYTFEGQKNTMEPTSSRYQASGIDNIKVFVSNTSFDNMTECVQLPETSLSNGDDKVFSLTDVMQDGYREKIKLYSPVNEGEDKYIKYEYTIEDAIVNYNDYAEVFWNFVGKDWQCDISNLNINLYINNSTNIKAYGHTYAKVDSFNIANNSVTMNVKNVSEGTAVDIRAVFPNNIMSYVTKKVNESYDFNTLDKLESQAKLDKQKYNISIIVWIIYAVINVIVFIYLISKASKNSNKNLKNMNKVEYYTDLPDTYSLGEYNCIRNKYFGYSDPNLIVATILDLANKKYIKLESLKKAKLFKDSYEYYVSVDVTKDLNNLNEYEKELINYIFNKKMSSDINLVDFEDNRFELNERFKELGLDYTLGAKYRKANLDKSTKMNKELYNPVPKSLWKMYSNTMLFVLAVALINIFLVSPITDKVTMLMTVFFIGIFTFAILGGIIGSSKSLKDEYVDSYNQLLGLQKYLKDYSLIKERYPIELVLWERYLVFASLFGIADKVAKEFKEELLNKGYDEDYIYTTYPFISVGMVSNTFTQSAASMSGSSSSGGYSGGGGGGGGRRWRWRRSLLIDKKDMYIFDNFRYNIVYKE